MLADLYSRLDPLLNWRHRNVVLTYICPVSSFHWDKELTRPTCFVLFHKFFLQRRSSIWRHSAYRHPPWGPTRVLVDSLWKRFVQLPMLPELPPMSARINAQHRLEHMARLGGLRLAKELRWLCVIVDRDFHSCQELPRGKGSDNVPLGAREYKPYYSPDFCECLIDIVSRVRTHGLTVTRESISINHRCALWRAFLKYRFLWSEIWIQMSLSVLKAPVMPWLGTFAFVETKIYLRLAGTKQVHGHRHRQKGGLELSTPEHLRVVINLEQVRKWTSKREKTVLGSLLAK